MGIVFFPQEASVGEIEDDVMEFKRQLKAAQEVLLLDTHRAGIETVEDQCTAVHQVNRVPMGRHPVLHQQLICSQLFSIRNSILQTSHEFTIFKQEHVTEYLLSRGMWRLCWLPHQKHCLEMQQRRSSPPQLTKSDARWSSMISTSVLETSPRFLTIENPYQLALQQNLNTIKSTRVVSSNHLLHNQCSPLCHRYEVVNLLTIELNGRLYLVDLRRFRPRSIKFCRIKRL